MGWFNPSLAHRRLGRLQEAIEHARRAVDLRPEDPHLSKALEDLLKEKEGKP
jgi:Flp pilus assembly protein TadD